MKKRDIAHSFQRAQPGRKRRDNIMRRCRGLLQRNGDPQMEDRHIHIIFGEQRKQKTP